MAFEILKPNLNNPHKASITLSYRHIQSDTIKSVWVKISEPMDLRKMVRNVLIQYYIINRKLIVGYSDIRNSIHNIEREAEEEAKDIINGGLV
jgi:hypothetical protein